MTQLGELGGHGDGEVYFFFGLLLLLASYSYNLAQPTHNYGPAGCGNREFFIPEDDYRKGSSAYSSPTSPRGVRTIP
jgi:hypothetical protein